MKNAARFAVVSVVSAISIGMAHAGATIYSPEQFGIARPAA